MTQKDKQLLLKDLCARLPYGVKLGFRDSNMVLEPREYNIFTNQLFTNQMNTESNITVGFGYEIHNYLPYLRPMSSMTEEEKEKIREQAHKYDTEVLKNAFEEKKLDGTAITHYAADWCNENHFDYRGLIPMGLALEAPDNMYK